jgi:ATP/maltotriose-dependent transcriptional regulator MalT/DNA-binding SARP family transcriptional activator
MPRSFRLLPPQPSPTLLARPRLMRVLLGRWESRVTSLVGGAGLGKTTVLAQAIAENQLAPRGRDLWFGLEAHDADAGRLGQAVTAALADEAGGEPSSTATPDDVAGVVWQLSPVEICLTFDDAHLVPAGSPGATWLAELIDVLPANGHVVLASRSDPSVPLSRLDAHGAVLRLREDALRFAPAELAEFAAHRGVDPDRLAETGGWPALAELSANVDPQLSGVYMWEEVLEPLGDERRHVLAVLSDLGGGDDALVGAALGTPVELASALQGVPLIARSAPGWHVAHALWREAPGLHLEADVRADLRRRAVEHLVAADRFDEAFTLVEESGAWDLAPRVLRAACLASDRLVAGQLERWLGASPPDVRMSVPGWLARSLLAAYTTPAAAVDPLRQAIARCREADDVDAEMVAIAQLARIAWFSQDQDILGEMVARVTELETTGHPGATALATVARAAIADLLGDDDGMLALLGSIEPSALDRAWELLVSFWAASVRLGLGETDPIHRIVERLHRDDDPALRGAGMAMRLSAWWAEGRVDTVVAGLPEMVAAMREAGVQINLYLALNGASLACSRTGDVATARRWYDESTGVAPSTPSGDLPMRSAVALAHLHLAEGLEKHAAVVLQSAVEAHGLDEGIDRDTWRQHIALGYILLPDTRPHWDGRALRGHLLTARQLAVAVVGVREGRAVAALRDLVLPAQGVVRSALDVRFAVELAVGLVEANRHADGRRLLGALGPPGRAALRDLASSGGRQSKYAKELLAAAPATPARHSYLAVLGPMTLRRDSPDGEPVAHPDLRRSRLRELLGFLVCNRETTRAAVGAAIWPDLDERAVANNLGVTLSRLQRVLEPWRPNGEPAYLLRHDGQALRLVTGTHLRIDVDAMEDHLGAASRAEADGIPSLALTHHLAVTETYRGDLLADLAEADWFSLDREHYRTRFVGAAVRAGQLLLGRGEPDEAEAVARGALAVDRWAEDAYGVLVGAALARHDHAGANRRMALCLETLHELGAAPSPSTRRLLLRLSEKTR